VGKNVEGGNVSSEGGLTLPLPQRGSPINGRSPVTTPTPTAFITRGQVFFGIVSQVDTSYFASKN
jgi:hypothetical protein